MSDDVYSRLARHLDDLPGGFPPTESGVEMRILKRLFTPQEAEMAMRLTMSPEPAAAIAERTGLPPDETAALLDGMESKGLIFSVHPRRGDPYYMAAQFVVGIWEYQVGRLDAEMARDMEEYMPALMRPEIWQQAPQLRAVPVGRAITPEMAIMDYETAESLVRAQKRFSVAPCICRKEKKLTGHGCDKPLEVCMAFGVGADFFARNGQGRYITQDEALAILAKADEAGLVLQPGNAKDAKFICACCGDCCGILTTLKRYPQPGRLVSTPFVVAHDPDLCTVCGVCVDRCQMEALRLDGDGIVLDVDRCVGCGLCVSTCPSEALRLVRKPEAEQRPVPQDVTEASIQLATARGKVDLWRMLGVGGT